MCRICHRPAHPALLLRTNKASLNHHKSPQVFCLRAFGGLFLAQDEGDFFLQQGFLGSA